MALGHMTLPEIDTLWDHDNPAETEQRFRELMPQAIASGNAPYVLELITQVARSLGLQRKFAEAHEALDFANARLAGMPPRVNVLYLIERGRVFNSSKQKGQALPLFTIAWEMACAAGEDGLAVDAAHMAAIASPRENKMEWNLAALRMAENSADPKARKWMGSLYNNIAWTYHDNGEYEEALKHFVKALAYEESQNQPKWARVARWSIGRTLRSLGKYEQALSVQREVEAQAEAAGEPDGFCAEEIGECLLALDRGDEARAYFVRAFHALSADEWLTENEPERIARLAELAGQ